MRRNMFVKNKLIKDRKWMRNLKEKYFQDSPEDYLFNWLSPSILLSENIFDKLVSFFSWTNWFLAQPRMTEDFRRLNAVFWVNWKHFCYQIFKRVWQVIVKLFCKMIPVSFCIAFDKESVIWITASSLKKWRDTINHAEEHNTSCKNINFFPVIRASCLELRGHIPFSSHTFFKFLTIEDRSSKSEVW